ncbi:MAG TPA: amidase [Burkholderiales bacterium]|nr:amidase [Burkholderiales bacterium]
MNDDILDLGLTELAAAIRKRTVSSYEATRACLERTERLQPHLNCFISIEADGALKAARAADRALARGAKVGLLHGVPLAHKDLFYRKGHISTGGAKILRDYRPRVTATVIERMQAAGAIWLGTLNMSEFAGNPTGHNEHFGDCRNAWNVQHVSGGSSSGSGVAVAARLCYGSLGSDTGGSIRHPAAFNGVVGLKPTYGRVSRFGVLPRSWSLDNVGPLARTVRDCARLMRVIAGADPNDSTCSSERVPDYEKELTGNVKGLRIGVPKNYYYENSSADVRRRMQESLKALESVGARLVELNVPDPQRLLDLSNVISQPEVAAVHGKWLRERPQDYSIWRGAIEPGLVISAASYLEAQMARPRLVREFIDAVFGRVDLLHAPVYSKPVPTIAEAMPRSPGDIPRVQGISRNNRPANFLGIPSLSVPAGFSSNGLPVAFQLMGRPFSEPLLLRVADAYQRVTDWHRRSPDLSRYLAK